MNFEYPPQIQGSRNQAEEGTLIILAAGEQTLFEECQTCFEAMGKNSFYLGDVGNASKMNLILQMLAGVSVAAVAEALSLGKFELSKHSIVMVQSKYWQDYISNNVSISNKFCILYAL